MVTTWPNDEVTTRSTRMHRVTRSRLTNNPVSTSSVICVWIGSGPSRISAVSDWKMRTSRPVSSSSRAGRTEGNNFMRRPGQEVLVLLMPEVAVDVAALDEVGMRADVVDLAALEHEDRVGPDQRGQP